MATNEQSNTIENQSNNSDNTQDNTNTRSKHTKAKSKGKQKENKANGVPQKLTLVNLAKEAAQIEEFKEVSLLDGKYTVKVRQKFLPSKIQQFVLDVKDALLILKSENASMQDIGSFFILYNCCLFKSFTDLPIQHLQLSKKRNVSKLLEVASSLMDLGIFEELISALPQDEMSKLNETIKKIENMGKDLGEIMVSATLNEQEKLRKLGLEYVGDGEVEDFDLGVGEDVVGEGEIDASTV